MYAIGGDQKRCKSMNELAINYDQQATLSTYSGGGTGLVGI